MMNDNNDYKANSSETNKPNIFQHHHHYQHNNYHHSPIELCNLEEQIIEFLKDRASIFPNFKQLQSHFPSDLQELIDYITKSVNNQMELTALLNILNESQLKFKHFKGLLKALKQGKIDSATNTNELKVKQSEINSRSLKKNNLLNLSVKHLFNNNLYSSSTTVYNNQSSTIPYKTYKDNHYPPIHELYLKHNNNNNNNKIITLYSSISTMNCYYILILIKIN